MGGGASTRGGGGGGATHHAAVPGQPPHRRTCLVLPQWRQVPRPCVGEVGAPGVQPGGAREEDPGVPPLHGPVNDGPLGPELGAIGALDGRQPDRAAHALVVGMPPPIVGRGKEILEAQDTRAQLLKGGKGTGGAGPRRWWGAGYTWAA